MGHAPEKAKRWLGEQESEAGQVAGASGGPSGWSKRLHVGGAPARKGKGPRLVE